MAKSLNVGMRELENGGNFPGLRHSGLGTRWLWGNFLGSLAQLDLPQPWACSSELMQAALVLEQLPGSPHEDIEGL